MDDETYALAALSDALSPYEEIRVTATFTQASDAHLHCMTEKVDVVFLDVAMPGINGVELTERLKQHDERIDLIFVTAYPDNKKEAAAVARFDYLLKPVRKIQLDSTVSRLASKQKS